MSVLWALGLRETTLSLVSPPVAGPPRRPASVSSIIFEFTPSQTPSQSCQLQIDPSCSHIMCEKGIVDGIGLECIPNEMTGLACRTV